MGVKKRRWRRYIEYHLFHVGNPKLMMKLGTSPKSYWFSLSTESLTPFDHLAKRHLRMFHLLNVTRTDDMKGESQLFFLVVCGAAGRPPC